MRQPAARWVLPAIVAAAAAAAPALAEVSAIKESPRGVSAALQMHDRSQAPPRIWSRVRQGVERDTLLNPDGDLYMDGPPSVTISPVTQLPEAVWSYWDGSHYQIAWSRFDGTRWTMVQTPLGPDFQFLTTGEYQNFDPKLWIDPAGNRRVTWWRSYGMQTDEVVVSVLPAGETQWWLPQRVSAEGVPTRRPDLRTYPSLGTFIVAEEDYGGTLSIVIFDCPPLDGHTPQRGSDPWGRTLVYTAGPSTSLDASLSGQASGGGFIPMVRWRAGNATAVSLYDAEAGAWPAPVFILDEGW